MIPSGNPTTDGLLAALRRQTSQHAMAWATPPTQLAGGFFSSISFSSGRVLERRQVPTDPARGGVAVLADCGALVAELGGGALPTGIGICTVPPVDACPAATIAAS